MSINKKRGSIALARQLCYEIAGATSEDDDISGSGYGSIDVAEILSAEVVRLQAALAQPEQEPWREFASDYKRGVIDGRQMQAQSSVDKAVNAMTQRPWQGLTDDDWGWVADKKGTSLDTFDQGAAWAQARLMERNK